MAYTMDWLLFAWILMLSSFLVEVFGEHSASLPAITDKAFIKECVETHNTARSSVQPPAPDMLHMTWDEGLAITARAWARNCDFIHNIHLKEVRRVHPVFSSVGENLWAGSPASSFTAKRAIDGWVNEKYDYTYATGVCAPSPIPPNRPFWGCGHYTQVVWASTYKVGCAVQLCPNGVKSTSFADREGALFVCNYATAGNLVGSKPYQRGGTCTGCVGECKGKLCHNQQRDEQQSYNWSPDWDPALSSCGPSCVAVLIIRPLALLATFIAAYTVQQLYPNIFCYE